MRAIEAEQQLKLLLGEQLGDIIALIKEINKVDSIYKINFPDSGIIDLTLEEMADYVAKTSNVYGRAARLAGMARSEYKISKGMYERKYKENKTGKNTDERERNATIACKEEHAAMTIASSLVDLAESLENSARIASESARKILDKQQSMLTASNREDRSPNFDSFYN